jgi:alpha-maltose-1-phosphate synthase
MRRHTKISRVMRMKVALLTREYPPEVYGGAGVHVEYLARELAQLIDVEVRCFGRDRGDSAGGNPRVRAFRPWAEPESGMAHNAAFATMSVNLQMAASRNGASLVHSHTWYANFGGHLAKLAHGIPHVATSHSLEPLRPWKAEQLGAGGYELSRFCERVALEATDALIAVSQEMKKDVLSCYPSIDPERVVVIHNGIDADEYRPDPSTDALERHGVDPDGSYIAFVGRITRQKGISHLLDAALDIDPTVQVVLCAGAPDTDDIAREVAAKVELVRNSRGNIVWIEAMLPKREIIQLLTHASVFCCPSVYEPLGIVNLEAMACETAVVATATGGIPEVVVDGVTGYLVPFHPGDPTTREAADPAGFARDMAERINALALDPATARRFGAAGRTRAVDEFSWSRIAAETLRLYERVLSKASSEQ